MENSKAIQFFKNLMSPIKELRTQAEKDFEILKTRPFSESFPIFEEGIKYSDPLICQLATLMLKKAYFDNNEIKDKLKSNEIEHVKLFIASQITFNNQDWKTLKRFGETLAMIYKLKKVEGYFSEIMELYNKSNIFARKLALFIISNLSDLGVIDDNIAEKYAKEFIMIFGSTIKDENDEIKSSAIVGFNKFIVNLKNEEVQNLFISLIEPLLLNILSLFKEKSAIEKEIFDSLIFLVDSYPKFFKDSIDILIDFVSKISLEKKIDFNLRTLSLEIIYSLAHSVPSKIRTSQNFKNIFIPLIFELLLDLDNINSFEQWEKLKNEDENDLEFMFYHIKSGLERISLDLGGEFFFNNIDNFVKKYLFSQNWVEKHAGFAALAFISEAAKDIYAKNLKNLLEYISQGLINENPRVRYIAMIFLGNLLMETAPLPQKEYVGNILPAIAKLLKGEQSLKMKSTASLTLNDFLAGLISKNKNVENNIQILKPYINELVEFILKMFEESLNKNYEPLQKNCLECISLLSNIHEKNFGQYYHEIMPGLKQLYYKVESKTPEQRQLRTNCINTIGYLFSSVSEEYELYKNDFIELSNRFVNDLENLPLEDPQIPAIIEAFINISIGINFQDFKPTFDKLFSFLEKRISADIGLNLKDAEVDEYIPNEGEQEKGVGSVIFNFGVKSKKISVNTFALQLKILSVDALNEIALNLGEDFKNYVEKYLNLTKNLLNFAFSRKIRKIAIKSIYTCINACSNDEERRKVFELIITELLGLLEYDIEAGFFKDMKCIIKYIGKSLHLFQDNPKIENTKIIKIFEVLKQVMTRVTSKINELYNLFKNDKDGIYDATDKSDQNSDISKLQKIYKYINFLVKGFKNIGEIEFSKEGKTLLDFYTSLLKEEIQNLSSDNIINDQKSKELHENNIAMCIDYFNIYMEYSELKIFTNFSFDYIAIRGNLKNFNIGENILSYIIEGYGIICKRQDNAIFKKNFINIINFIQEVLNRNTTDDNLITHDKAIRALGKYIYYKCSNDNDLSEDYKLNLTNNFLKLLPATGDLEESNIICEELFDQITEEKCSLLLAENIEPELKKAVYRIIELNSKENFIEDLTKLLKTSLTLGLNFSHLVD